MTRLERIFRLLQMGGNFGELCASGIVIVFGFVVGIYAGRFLLNLF